MAKEHVFEMYGHPSIYKAAERKLKVYFCEPEQGINKNTGIILLIPGFGANSSSNVYKKMRREFADKYNLITVQCDFFGFEFLQNVDYFMRNYKVDVQINNKFFRFNSDTVMDIFKLLHTSQVQGLTIEGKVRDLSETADYCCDMCVMQALDNITAVLTVISIIEENGYEWDKKNVILYGTSHGSYISYVCNAFAPFLFTLLVDCSAYTFPTWLTKRTTYSVYTEQNLGLQVQLNITFNYIISCIFSDLEVYHLPTLYKTFNNRCKIVSYHGTEDEHTSIFEKREFCNSINNCTFNEITNDTLKERLFKSTTHNLGMDLLQLFEYVMNNHERNQEEIDWKPMVTFSTKEYTYLLDYSNRVPTLKLSKNG